MKGVVELIFTGTVNCYLRGSCVLQLWCYTPCLVLSLLRLSSIFKVYSKAKGKSSLLRIDPSCVKDLGVGFCITYIYSASDTSDTYFHEDLL